MPPFHAIVLSAILIIIVIVSISIMIVVSTMVTLWPR